MKVDLVETPQPRLVDPAVSTGRMTRHADLNDTRKTSPAEREAKAFASSLIAKTPSWQIFSAASILEEHPNLQRCESVVVDLAYEEFCRRMDAGESLDPHEFARQFPAVEQPLLDLFRVHSYVEKHPDALLSDVAPDWPEAGAQVASFELISELGRGTFSRVFLARESHLGDRPVVVKVCRQTTQSRDEAARLGQLSHPNIVPVYSVQSQPEAGLTYICMPYHGSATLLDVVDVAFQGKEPPRRGELILDVAQRPGKLAIADDEAADTPPHWTLRRGTYVQAVREMASQLCDALAYTHRKGITHGDIKPSNVLLTSQGCAQLIDFNLSHQEDRGVATVGGTLPYMAPEQLQYLVDGDETAEPVTDPRSDLFSMGVMLYQLLTGKLPFPPDLDQESKQKSAEIQLEQQRSKTDVAEDLKRVVDSRTATVIASCLAFEPRRRPQSAEVLAEAFRLTPSPRAVRNHKIAVVIGAMLFYLAASAATATGLKSLGEHQLVRGWEKLQKAQLKTVDDQRRRTWLDRAHGDFASAYRLDRSGAASASLATYESMVEHFPEAAEYYQHAVEHGMRTVRTLNNWGVCLSKDKRPLDAQSVLAEAVRLDPNKAIPHRNLALVEHRLACLTGDASHLRAAIDHINEARRLAPEIAGLELDRACIYAAAMTMALEAEPGENFRQEVKDSSVAATKLGLGGEALKEPLDLSIRTSQAVKGLSADEATFIDDRDFQTLFAQPAPDEAPIEKPKAGSLAKPKAKSVAEPKAKSVAEPEIASLQPRRLQLMGLYWEVCGQLGIELAPKR